MGFYSQGWFIIMIEVKRGDVIKIDAGQKPLQYIHS
jgi:hypothetical protein